MRNDRNTVIEAKYYDSEYTFNEDVDFYLYLIGEGSRRILELGCGTGRLLIPIAEAGHRVKGIDNSKFMLKHLEQKYKTLSPDLRRRIRFHNADMRTFALRERFDVVLLAFNLFFMAESRADQIAILNCVRAHLKPGGRIIISTLNPVQDWFRNKISEVKYYGTWTMKDTATVYDRFYANQLSQSEQKMAFRLMYDTISPDGTLRREKNTITLSYLHSFELQHFLECTGYTVTRIFGGYNGEPFTPGCKLMIFEGRKN